MNEDTLVQVSNVSGGWEDLGRSTREEALATVARGTVPGLDLHGATLRAVDWITREEVTMTTTTVPVPADLDAETAQQLRHERANGVTLAELRKAYPSLSLATIKAAVSGVETAKPPTTDYKKLEEAGIVKTPKRRAKAPVSTKRVAPVEPDYSKLPAGKRAAAKKVYQAAVREFEAADVTEPGGNVAPKSTAKSSAKAPAKGRAPEPKKSTAKPSAKAPAKSTKKSAPAKAAEDDGVDWNSKAVANRIVKMKQDGSTIKEIAEALDLPAVHRSWLRVSLVWRREADARGLSRPRHSAETVSKRIATRREKASA
jgi:hypothetical protein